jgi:endothelin-converting enzyme
VEFAAFFSSFAPRVFPGRIIVTDPVYLESLSSLLRDASSEVVQSYLLIQASLHFAPYLGDRTPVWHSVAEFSSRYSSIEKPRSDFCVAQTVKAFDFAVGRFFAGEALSANTANRSHQIVAGVLDSFANALPHSSWMDQSSSRQAIEKLGNLRVKIGLPFNSPNTSSPSSVAAFYAPVHVNRTDFFQSTLGARTNLLSKSWRNIGRSNSPLSWAESTISAWPIYRPNTNEIILPAGVLHDPFFSTQWPGYILYGGLGGAIARELTHAFDLIGRSYNSQGALGDWWTSSTKKAFHGVQECIQNQLMDETPESYNQLREDTTNVIQIIATSGIRLAYQAWTIQVNRTIHTGQEYLLPNLNLTREQLFYISFAQSLAENRISPKSESSSSLKRLDSKQRVESALKNIPEFSSAFECPVGSKLNPASKKRCTIW